MSAEMEKIIEEIRRLCELEDYNGLRKLLFDVLETQEAKNLVDEVLRYMEKQKEDESYDIQIMHELRKLSQQQKKRILPFMRQV